MNRILTSLAAATLLAVALNASAADMPKHGAMSKHAMAASKPATITGEVVDTGCYLEHGARGAKHVECANKCISGGMPMGILTAQGALYLVTLNHENADPYNQLKNMAGQTVTVTGAIAERNGMKGIDVTEIKPSAAKAQ